MNKSLKNLPIYLHEIKLKGKDNFTMRFNECSDLWAKINNKTLSAEERKEALETFIHKRQCLELGIE